MEAWYGSMTCLALGFGGAKKLARRRGKSSTFVLLVQVRFLCHLSFFDVYNTEYGLLRKVRSSEGLPDLNLHGICVVVCCFDKSIGFRKYRINNPMW